MVLDSHCKITSYILLGVSWKNRKKELSGISLTEVIALVSLQCFDHVHWAREWASDEYKTLLQLSRTSSGRIGSRVKWLGWIHLEHDCYNGVRASAIHLALM